MSDDYKLFIFDADGTLRRCTVPGQPTPNRHDEWELMPNVREVLAQFDWSKHAFGVASNQAGVALGFLSEQVARKLLVNMIFQATGILPQPEIIQMCVHAVDAGCSCRKPQPGMLIALMELWKVSPADTLYAGCDFTWAKWFFGWEPWHGEQT